MAKFEVRNGNLEDHPAVSRGSRSVGSVGSVGPASLVSKPPFSWVMPNIPSGKLT